MIQFVELQVSLERVLERISTFHFEISPVNGL
jgi:hypothetical protein